MYHYVYRLTHLPTGRHYYGVRSSKSHPADDLGVIYLTSSSSVKSLLKRDGLDSFKRRFILLKSRDRANLLETRLLKRYDVRNNEKFFNRTVTAEEWHTLSKRPWNYGIAYNLSASERKEKFGQCGKANGFYGRKHSEASLKKMRAKLSKRMSATGNPFYGRSHSKETKEKIRASRRKPITVNFLNGESLRFEDRGELGSHLKMSRSMGAQLAKLPHIVGSKSHLWEKYGIREVIYEDSISQEDQRKEKSV